MSHLLRNPDDDIPPNPIVSALLLINKHWLAIGGADGGGAAR